MMITIIPLNPRDAPSHHPKITSPLGPLSPNLDKGKAGQLALTVLSDRQSNRTESEEQKMWIVMSSQHYFVKENTIQFNFWNHLNII